MGARPKVSSVDFGCFDPKVLQRRFRAGAASRDHGEVDTEQQQQQQQQQQQHRHHVSLGAAPSVNSSPIIRDEFGRRVKSNSGSDAESLLTRGRGIESGAATAYLFDSRSSSSSFGEGGSGSGGSGARKSDAFERERSPSIFDESGSGSLRLSSPSHSNLRSLGLRASSQQSKAGTLPEGGKYAVVSGGARKAPSIEHLKPWTVQTEADIADKYMVDKNQMLGEGTYSRVYSAKHRELGATFAVKCIEKAYLVSDEETESLKREVELHLRLHHPHIVRLYEVYEDLKCLWLVMERTSQGTLSSLCDYAGRIESEELACKIVHQILLAVRYLHSNGVLHSDIKPDNVVVDRPSGGEFGTSKTPTVKLCDFGLARKVPNVKYFKYTRDVHKVPFTGVCGTPGYIAPELLRRQAYGISADMWSIGIILYELIAGRPPFRPAAQCLERPVGFEGIKWRKASKEVIDMVTRLLVVDASQRMTAKEALKHAWFTKFGVGWLSEPRVM